MDKGMIHALVLDGQGGAKFLNAAQIKQWSPEQGQLWLHLDYSVYDTKEWLFHESDLDLSVAETLMSSESRPRFSMMEEGVLFAWRGVNKNADEDDVDDLVALRLWKDENRLITTRHRKFNAVNTIVSALNMGKGAKDLGELLVTLADTMVWEISEMIDDLEETMGEMEERVLDEGNISLRGAISSLRRQVISIRRYIAPQKEALIRFSSEKLDWIDSEDRMELREVVDRITRGLEDLEALRERAAVAQEELQNKISEELNNRMYVLSVITAIFLPLGFLTGLFGINLGGMPGAESSDAFRIFVIIMVTLVVAQLVIFKWKKWF